MLTLATFALSLLQASGPGMDADELAALMARANPEEIREVSLHPLFAQDAMCSEHWAGQLLFPGDALGQDCMVVGGIEERGYLSPYRTDGRANEDWYGWQAPVLSPVSGNVTRVLENDVVNQPGVLGQPPAQALMITREDGLIVVVAHLGEISVAVGDHVEAGQPVGTVGNNGYSRAPHIHVGAADNRGSLQIRWDLKALAGLRADNEDGVAEHD